MSSTALAQTPGASTTPLSTRHLWTAYAILATLLLAYIVALLIHPAYAGVTSISGGWGVDGFEFVVAALCLSKALVGKAHPRMPLFLGCALASWCGGDIALTIQSLGGRQPSSPSVADIFYLGFYPLAYIAIVLFMRGELRRLTAPSWLDGAVAGLGAAAVCAAFAFHNIIHSTGGHTLSAAVNVAYPIGDLLLLALVVGGTAVLPGRRRTPWLLIAGACALNTVGDTFNLFSSTIGSSHVGTLFDTVAWPGSFLLMSMAVWVRPRAANPLAPQRPAGFLLPGIAAVAGLVILFTGTLHGLSRVSIGLATATLVLVGLRLALSARGLRLLTEQRHRQSMTDELTGLGNRRYLFHVLNTFFSDLADPLLPTRQLAFLFLDLDHFKAINDSFGHAAGDKLLRQLGPRLTTTLRSTDVLVRLGGDEFAVVLLNADAEYATRVAERLMAEFAHPFVLDVVSATIGASIGIAIAPQHASDPAGVLRCADIAMYRAKLEQSSIETYNEDLDDDGNLLRLAEELRLAVQERQFVLHYQPQLDLHTGQFSGVEALLRWPHPRLGLLAPLKFLPVAEEAGVMPSLTALVLDDALRQWAEWRAAGHDIDLAINVSPSNLLDAGFMGSISERLETHQLPPARLVIEITETCIITDYERSRAVIEELRDLGVIVSIDDFGAGFTSLAYLRDLAVGELKLDRTFVSGLLSEDKARGIDLIRSTIELGHALGLRVVAEGVEDLATLEVLGQIGCDIAQGYFISKPLPADELVLRADISAEAEVVLGS
ncbi:MAG: putative bifunctional diguanylate cyclase/phosphodiesterase [Acidimicrobiales bacterium]